MTDDDDEIVRRLLSATYGGHPASWTPPSDNEYVAEVTARMAELRREHPDGDYPAPTHDADERGACVECDALTALFCVIYTPADLGSSR